MAIEKNLENKLMRECKKLGVLCEKYPPIFWAGVPDRLLILPNGGVIWVEMKAPNGVLSPIQRKVHSKLWALNQRVEVLYTLEQVRIFMLSLAREIDDWRAARNLTHESRDYQYETWRKP